MLIIAKSREISYAKFSWKSQVENSQDLPEDYLIIHSPSRTVLVI